MLFIRRLKPTAIKYKRVRIIAVGFNRRAIKEWDKGFSQKIGSDSLICTRAFLYLCKTGEFPILHQPISK